jgi:hypothetical protein
MLLHRFLFWGSALVVGLASAWWVVRSGGDESVTVGAWRSEVLAGSVEAGPYTRARVALGGLLALGPEETLYFVAERDDSGRPLRADCAYHVSGPTPVARWWSVTAYGDDRFLLPAPQHRYSVNSAAQGAVPGRVAFTTGPRPPAGETSERGADALPPATGSWLPTPGDKGLLLVLRLYQPGPALRANAGSLVPLSIAAVGACE